MSFYIRLSAAIYYSRYWIAFLLASCCSALNRYASSLFFWSEARFLSRIWSLSCLRQFRCVICSLISSYSTICSISFYYLAFTLSNFYISYSIIALYGALLAPSHVPAIVVGVLKLLGLFTCVWELYYCVLFSSEIDPRFDVVVVLKAEERLRCL